MSEVKIGFKYGVLTEPLIEQAKEQGYDLKNHEMFEKIREAINMCAFHVATDSQVTTMFKKLHNKVVKNLTLLK